MLKKFLFFILLCLIVGCKKDSAGNEDISNSNDEKIKIIFNIENQMDNPDIMSGIKDLQTDPKYSNYIIDVWEKPSDYASEMPLSVASGVAQDIIAIYNPYEMSQYNTQGIILPLNKYFDELGIDFDNTFGNYAKMSKIDGNTLIVPYNPTKWVLFYNKNVFDHAGIPYPDSEKPMTWKEYRELAKKLTFIENGEKTFGALHFNWGIFWYGEALMRINGGRNFYNSKGLSNIDDPSFKTALIRTYEMMHVDESIPSFAKNVIDGLKPTDFMSGKYGMFIQGPWVLNFLIDKVTYPRDFEVGIAPLPVFEGSKNRITWGVVSGFAVSKSSPHPEEAAKIAVELVKLASKYATVAPSTYISADSKDLFARIYDVLGVEGITKEVLNYNYSSQEVLFLDEKITGVKSVEYNSVMHEEVEKFLTKKQSVETTISNIKTRVDKLLSQ